MDTHLHTVVEGTKSDAHAAIVAAATAHAAHFNERHAGMAPFLRGNVEALTVAGCVELARTIRYDHENPTKTKTPIVGDELEWPWSSARAFRGLARTPYPNVARAHELLGTQARGTLIRRVELTDLDPVRTPCATPGRILTAAAQTFGLLGRELASAQLGVCREARAVFVALARLEFYSDSQLGPFLKRSRAQVSRLGSGPVDTMAVRIARTLIRTPAFAARLADEPDRRIRGQQAASEGTGCTVSAR
jgi:hypothetical protein